MQFLYTHQTVILFLESPVFIVNQEPFLFLFLFPIPCHFHYPISLWATLSVRKFRLLSFRFINRVAIVTIYSRPLESCFLPLVPELY
jgi:hypothetical protein